MITAGIVGVSGYMGGEALRKLLEHPEVKVKWATSRNPENIADFHPNLYGAEVNIIKLEDASPCDVIFVALPTEASLSTINGFIGNGCKVIDLGAAFRLKDIPVWERVYGLKHPYPGLVDRAVYGISELHFNGLRQTDLVANPGCFASSAVLGLSPLIAAEIIDTEHIIVDGLSGTAGAGAELARPAHHPEIANNLVPYNVVDHRHSYEIEQELSIQSGANIKVNLTTTYVPIVRGILTLSHCFPKTKVDRNSLLEIFKKFYKDSYFVKIYDMPKEENASWQYKPYPWVNSVAGTNYCQIGLDYDEKRERIVVFSVLDSIGKGGALAGIENMNIMFGLPRETGISSRGMHPI